MKSTKLFSILLSYLFITIGLGVTAEVFLIKDNPSIIIPFRFFYWVLNTITFGHFIMLIPYQKMENEGKKSRWIFFITINHFIVCLVAILLYALIFFEGNKVDGMLAVAIYGALFVFFTSVVMKVSKK